MPRVLTAAHWQVNRAHPLAQGLAAAIVPASNTNLITQKVGAVAGTITSRPTSMGAGITYDPVSFGRQTWSEPTAYNATSSFTVLMVCQCPGGANMRGVNRWGANANDRSFILQPLTDGSVQFATSDGAGAFDILATTAGDIANGSTVAVLGTRSANAYQDVWINGRKAGTRTPTSGVLAVTNAGVLAVGSDADGGNGGVGTIVLALYYPKRAFTAAESQALTADPFQVLEQTRGRQTVIILSRGAGGTPQALAGGIAATSTVSGTTLGMTYALAGASAGLSTVAGTSPTIVYGLTGASTGTSTVAGTTPTMTYGLSGSPAAVSTVSGTTLTMRYALVGSTAAQSALTGDISTSALIADDPNALKFTFRETGHTMTLRERGHTMTFRERA